MGVSRRRVVAAGVASLGGLLGGYYLLRSAGGVGDGGSGPGGSGGDGSGDGAGDGGGGERQVRLGQVSVDNLDAEPHTVTVAVARDGETVAVETLDLDPGVPEGAENDSVVTTVGVSRSVERSWSGTGDYVVGVETEAGGSERVVVAEAAEGDCASVHASVFSGTQVSVSTLGCVGV